MACREGCPTQDCASYAECCRSINIDKTSLKTK
jgi:hypothetical protein